MQFSVSRESISQLLYLTSTIVEKKTTMPILAHVNLVAGDGKLSIMATDLEIALKGSIKADIKTSGSITVAGKVFYEIVRELPSESLTIQLGKGNRIEIEAGTARFKVNGVSSDEYPKLKGIELKNDTPVDSGKLYEMLDKTAFSVSVDETRYNINGVYVEATQQGGKDFLRFVATDGHRLAMIDRPAEGLTLSSNVIIPKKGITELKKLLEKQDGVAHVALNEGFFTVQTTTQDGTVTVGVRLVDGQFPDYRQVIPVETKTVITASRAELLSAVKRVSLMTSDKSKTVKFRLVGGNLVVSSSSPEFGEASEALTVSQKGEDITIGFSARYVLDLLNAMPLSSEVTINLNGELGPGVFKGSEDELYSCVVMPMRFE
jgi:DNA polymerase-3 subunit beta